MMELVFFRSQLLYVLFFVLAAISLSAQETVYRSFTEEEGLPGNDVYDVIVDDAGIMWFATDNGVSRFDGQNFINYNVSDGLPTNSTLKLYKDLFGRIWFLAYNGKLSYIDGYTVHSYAFNDSIIRYFTDNYFNRILVDSAGGLLLAPRQGSYGFISSDGKVETDRSLIPDHRTDSCFLMFELKGDDHFITIVKQKPAHSWSDGRLFLAGDAWYFKVEHSPREFHRNLVEMPDGSYLLSYRRNVYHFRDSMILQVREFEEEVLNLFVDNNDRLWVSIKYDHGIYKFEEADLDSPGTNYFSGYTIGGITQDREGGYWLGTEGHGVIHIPGLDFSHFTLPWDDRSLNVMELEISGGRIWFSSRDKEVYGGKLKEGMINDIYRLNIDEPYDWIKHICVDSRNNLWLSSTKHLRYDPAGFPRPLDTVFNATFLSGGLGDTIIVASRKLGIYQNDRLLFISNPDSLRRVYASYHERGKGIWLGTLYGLYLFKNGEASFKGGISPILKERISSLNKIGENLVVGTTAYGLLFINHDSIKYHITEEDGLMGNSVKTTFVENDSIIWVGTKDGLTRIVFKKLNNEFWTESYRHSDGLPSSEINDIGMHDGYIWLATGKGLVSFDPDNLTPHTVPPIIQITSFEIGGIDTNLHENYVLSHKQNDIRITFTGISYRTDEALRYRYQLGNYNDNIIYTKNNWANFPNLPPGEYTFFVNAGNAHGIWNEEPLRINFRIKKHFTQTIWFMVLLIIASSLTVALISVYFQRQKKIRENARNELARMEQRLFRLQMNPHFVFNALLAIQGYMYMNNPKQAGRYLTSFAKLIRHTLYGSSEEYITLDKELEALQYYLELQRLRFNEHFDFAINVEDDIIQEATYLPPLLIQPFLENAIEHGLQHRESGGMLKLNITIEQDCLMVRIEDNGIGREESMKIQAEKGKLHKSMGMNIVQKRVNSLNRILSTKITLEIIDLKTDSGKAAGTLVKICIPYRSA